MNTKLWLLGYFIALIIPINAMHEYALCDRRFAPWPSISESLVALERLTEDPLYVAAIQAAKAGDEDTIKEIGSKTSPETRQKLFINLGMLALHPERVTWFLEHTTQVPTHEYPFMQFGNEIRNGTRTNLSLEERLEKGVRIVRLLIESGNSHTVLLLTKALESTHPTVEDTTLKPLLDEITSLTTLVKSATCGCTHTERVVRES